MRRVVTAETGILHGGRRVPGGIGTDDVGAQHVASDSSGSTAMQQKLQATSSIVLEVTAVVLVAVATFTAAAVVTGQHFSVAPVGAIAGILGAAHLSPAMMAKPRRRRMLRSIAAATASALAVTVASMLIG